MNIMHLVNALPGVAAQGLIAKAVMSSGAGDDSVLFAGDWVMEHKYPFWTAWKEAT